jgi:hypothetical protein
LQDLVASGEVTFDSLDPPPIDPVPLKSEEIIPDSSPTSNPNPIESLIPSKPEELIPSKPLSNTSGVDITLTTGIHIKIYTSKLVINIYIYIHI